MGAGPERPRSGGSFSRRSFAPHRPGGHFRKEALARGEGAGALIWLDRGRVELDGREGRWREARARVALVWLELDGRKGRWRGRWGAGGGFMASRGGQAGGRAWNGFGTSIPRSIPRKQGRRRLPPASLFFYLSISLKEKKERGW